VTPPTIAPARPEIVTRGVPAPRPGWVERVTSADHKSVGTLYIGTALVFLILAAVEFALMRMQLLVPENSLISPEIFNRLLSAAGVTTVVLFTIPLALGFISYLAPLQIGARTVALPRLNLFSYWLYAIGAVAIYASFLYSVPEAGTYSLPPLSETTFSPTHGVDAWITGVALACAGFTLFAVNMVVTLIRMRAPGMAWRRLPLFSWAATATSGLLLVLAPAMLAAVVMLMIDRQFDGVFFEAGEGGAPLLYEHLAMLFAAGGYAIVLLLAAGSISEILPTFSGQPIFSHRGAAASIVAIAILVPLAWMQSMYAAPLAEGWTIMAMAFALALVVPIGTLLFIWVGTLWRGALRLRAPMLYALAAISTMSFGLTGELVYSVIPVGWQLDNTTAAHANTLYVLVGGGVMGGFAALHYWFPKLSGRVLAEGLGKIALGLIFVGIHLYALPMILAGLEGQPVDIFKYYENTGVDGYNLIASIGAFVLVAGILFELANAAHSWNNGLEAGHDPWAASTLEWFALSPPPPHNFDAVPDVRSTEPLRDIREAVRRRTEFWEAPPRPRPAPARAPSAAPVAFAESDESAGSEPPSADEDDGRSPSVA
jgi:heme/copper-type cytochrome/quinol oxidase subunit 1